MGATIAGIVNILLHAIGYGVVAMGCAEIIATTIDRHDSSCSGYAGSVARHPSRDDFDYLARSA